MVNINKLKAKIIENGLNVESLAQKIGIDKATLYRRLNNNGETITIGEADKMIHELHLTREDVNDIFFASNVA